MPLIIIFPRIIDQPKRLANIKYLEMANLRNKTHFYTKYIPARQKNI